MILLGQKIFFYIKRFFRPKSNFQTKRFFPAKKNIFYTKRFFLPKNIFIEKDFCLFILHTCTLCITFLWNSGGRPGTSRRAAPQFRQNCLKKCFSKTIITNHSSSRTPNAIPDSQLFFPKFWVKKYFLPENLFLCKKFVLSKRIIFC